MKRFSFLWDTLLFLKCMWVLRVVYGWEHGDYFLDEPITLTGTEWVDAVYMSYHLIKISDPMMPNYSIWQQIRVVLDYNPRYSYDNLRKVNAELVKLHMWYHQKR